MEARTTEILLAALEAEQNAHRLTRLLLHERTCELEAQEKNYNQLWQTLRECQSLKYDDTPNPCRELEMMLFEQQLEAQERQASQEKMARCGSVFVTEELRRAICTQQELHLTGQLAAQRADASVKQQLLLEQELDLVNGKLALAERDIEILTLTLDGVRQERDIGHRGLLRCTWEVAVHEDTIEATETALEAAQVDNAALRTEIERLACAIQTNKDAHLDSCTTAQQRVEQENAVGGSRHTRNIAARAELQRVACELEKPLLEAADMRNCRQKGLQPPCRHLSCDEDSPYLLPSSASPMLIAQMREIQLE